jgi:ATP-dependent Lhr-like helicase
LIEALKSREGFHLFVYPFAGRLLNEGVASVMSLRAARKTPRTFSITTNEYGFELLCEEEFEVAEAELRRWLSPDDLLSDLLASVNVSDLARRQFRDIARIAGLVDPGTPRRGKTTRQLQVSSGLMFDVLERHDADNLLLEQARREVLDAQLDHAAVRGVLQRMMQRHWTIARPERLTPLGFPLWADRLQTQTLSTESWQARVEREARRLEKLAN